MVLTRGLAVIQFINIYQHLSEYLADRRLIIKLIFFYKIILCLQPFYLQNYLTPYDNVRTNLTRSSTQKSIKTFRAKTKAFESSFFPDCAKECVKLSQQLRNINSINLFKSSILNFLWLRENSDFAVHDIYGL